MSSVPVHSSDWKWKGNPNTLHSGIFQWVCSTRLVRCYNIQLFQSCLPFSLFISFYLFCSTYICFLIITKITWQHTLPIYAIDPSITVYHSIFICQCGKYIFCSMKYAIGTSDMKKDTGCIRNQYFWGKTECDQSVWIHSIHSIKV